MKESLFRKEVIEKMTSPADLNSYVKVLRPRVWLLLFGVALAAGGLIFFVASTGFPVAELFFGVQR